MNAYCDYNATAPLRPEAAEAVARALAIGGNPSSVHRTGRAARKLVEDAREQVARAVNASAENVVFTAGATEALHLALEASRGAAKSFIYSAIEHDAVAEHIAHVWPDARVAPVGNDGRVDLDALAALLVEAPKPALVAVMLANNETGIVQPYSQVARLVREHGGLLLVDAVQALGRMIVDIADVDASYLVLSSHKIGGPPGVGALVLAPGAPFRVARGGGGQERGRRPGTENVAGIAGFGEAAVQAARMDDLAHVEYLRDHFEKKLGLEVIGQGVRRLPNTSLFVLPNMRAETAVIALDLAGVCVSAGAACSSGKVRKSRVLEAMGAPALWQTNAVRASFGWNSKAADVEALLGAVARVTAKEFA